jgi:hypothetical protein
MLPEKQPGPHIAILVHDHLQIFGDGMLDRYHSPLRTHLPRRLIDLYSIAFQKAAV